MSNKLTIFVVLFIFSQVITWVYAQLAIDTYEQFELIKRVSINFGMGLGITMTLFACYLWLLSAYNDIGLKSCYTSPIVVASIFTLVALPFGLIIGVIGTGTLGGALVSGLFQWLNFNERLGISIGIGLGVFVGSVIPTILATIIGFNLGKLFHKPAELGH